MSAVATLKVLDAIITGMTLVTETNKAMQKAALLLQTAQGGGREVTDEEEAALRKETDDAIAGLQAATRV